jgi:hypothetical protein
VLNYWQASCIRLFLVIKGNPVILKEQVVLVVGAASSRDHSISRLEAAPTGSLFMVTWTFRISAKGNFHLQVSKPTSYAGGLFS